MDPSSIEAVVGSNENKEEFVIAKVSEWVKQTGSFNQFRIS